jgi:uncharacterized coiled-coil DUF342 family protein
VPEFNHRQNPNDVLAMLRDHYQQERDKLSARRHELTKQLAELNSEMSVLTQRINETIRLIGA